MQTGTVNTEWIDRHRLELQTGTDTRRLEPQTGTTDWNRYMQTGTY